MSVEYNEEGSMVDFMGELDKSMKKIHDGDIIEGTVLSVSDSEVLVNIGYVADGIITRENLTDDSSLSPKDLVKIGDQIKVYVIELNDGEGNVSLSKLLADSLGVWDDFEDSLNAGSSLDVKVSEIVKGGAVASVKGVRAFIPASQLSTHYVENMNDFLGKTMTVKVIELDRDKNKVILSRKEVEKEENEVKKDLLWSTLKKGEKKSGVVTRLAKFGAFVDIGGMDGLIHLSELSWKRVNNPSEVVSVGDRVEVYILDFDKEKGRVSLGLKEVSENPWNTAFSKYKVGSIVEVTVSRFMDFGVFVELEPGLDGLVHISEISEDRISKASDVLNIGDKVKVKVLEVNEENKKIALSIKDAAVKAEVDFSEYNENTSGVTIGDLLKDKLKNFKFE